MNTAKKFPKILIISPNAIGLTANASIMMHNLFSYWPTSSIYSIYNNINYPPDKKYASQVFYLGSSKSNTWIENVMSLDKYFSFSPSKNLCDWLNNIEFDVIYSHLGSPMMMLLTQFCVEFTQRPLVNHIMDDYIISWPSIGGKAIPQFLHQPMNRYAQAIFKESLSIASINYAISSMMAHEYSQRYNMKFLELHNGILIPKSSSIPEEKEVNLNSPLRLIYMGSIAKNVNESILKKICYLVENNNIRIELDVLSKDHSLLSGYFGNKVKVIPPIAHEKVLSLMQNYDALLLPYNFDERSIRFIKHSMPTRLGEYTISGVPILSIGSPEVGFLQELEDANSTFLIKSEEDEVLKDGIVEFIHLQAHWNQWALNAQQYAEQKWDIQNIQHQLSRDLCGLC